MPHSQQLPRFLLISADAWSAAEELAEQFGVNVRLLIEMLLINFRYEFRYELHNAGVAESEAPESDDPVDDPRVVPISRARRRHRR